MQAEDTKKEKAEEDKEEEPEGDDGSDGEDGEGQARARRLWHGGATPLVECAQLLSDVTMQPTGPGGFQAQRQSTRRKPHVDLARLDVRDECALRCSSDDASQVATLRKYRRAFKLGDPQQTGTKEELLPAVVKHWQNQVRVEGETSIAHADAAKVVDEDETLLAFVFALRKQAQAGIKKR